MAKYKFLSCFFEKKSHSLDMWGLGPAKTCSFLRRASFPITADVEIC